MKGNVGFGENSDAFRHENRYPSHPSNTCCELVSFLTPAVTSNLKCVYISLFTVKSLSHINICIDATTISLGLIAHRLITEVNQNYAISGHKVCLAVRNKLNRRIK